MASNRFGNTFCVTTWGESHGPAIGAVIDGCPAGLSISEEEINRELEKRRPGGALTSGRKEPDECHILSGVFEGQTTGAPISLIIYNRDARSKNYESIKDQLRPGHANYTYLQKYGIYDYRGGGRASGRETAMRVAAGAIAKKLLASHGIEVTAYLAQLHTIETPAVENLRAALEKSSLFCPCPETEAAMRQAILQAKSEGDSLGGAVKFIASGVPVGLGDPIYEKLEANFAKAMLSIPASRGVAFGAGWRAASMRGSEHNDRFTLIDGAVATATNHAGGIQAGISNGMPVELEVAFKPTSTIGKSQETLTVDQRKTTIVPEATDRHDPALVIRAVPVVEAMGALTLIDALLSAKQSIKLSRSVNYQFI